MKIVNIKGILILSCIVYASCNKDIKSDSIVPIISVDIPAKDRVDYQDMFALKQIIHLETTESSLIQSIGAVYMKDSSIIVFDDRQQRILSFDSNGHYLHDIGTYGEGPDEYLNINEVRIFDDKIYAHERTHNEMMIYNFQGDLLNKIKSAFSFNSFCKVNDGFWIYTCFTDNNPNACNLMFVDESLQKKKAEFFPQDKHFVNVTSGSKFFITDSIPYFTYPTSNVIYGLKGSEAMPCYQIDFGEHTPDYNKLATFSDYKSYDSYMQDNGLSRMDDVVIWKHHLLFSYRLYLLEKRVSLFRAFCDLNSNKNLFYEYVKGTYPILTSSKRCGHDDNYLYFMCQPYDLADKDLTFLKDNYGLNISKESNPLLLLVDLKEEKL